MRMRGLVVLGLVLLLTAAVLTSCLGCGTTTTDKEDSAVPETIKEVEQKAQEASRDANLRLIDTAIQLYYTENGTWPTSVSQLSGYMKTIPTDPMGGTYYIKMVEGEAKAAVR